MPFVEIDAWAVSIPAHFERSRTSRDPLVDRQRADCSKRSLADFQESSRIVDGRTNVTEDVDHDGRIGHGKTRVATPGWRAEPDRFFLLSLTTVGWKPPRP